MELSNRLSSLEYWSDVWTTKNEEIIKFNPHKPFFRDIHRILMRNLPQGKGLRLLEIGCYPGRYMWYFHKFFGYQVSGIEYVEWCAQKLTQILSKNNVPAEIINADLFNYQLPSPENRWDIVTSFGLIEHFVDTKDVIQKHLELLKPGGYLVLVIPNHQKIYGEMLKMCDRQQYAIHNRMTYEDMVQELEDLGNTEILEGGYYSHLGFWNCGLYDLLQKKSTILYLLVRIPLWLIECVGCILPNNSLLSPLTAVIARKLAY